MKVEDMYWMILLFAFVSLASFQLARKQFVSHSLLVQYRQLARCRGYYCPIRHASRSSPVPIYTFEASITSNPSCQQFHCNTQNTYGNIAIRSIIGVFVCLSFVDTTTQQQTTPYGYDIFWTDKYSFRARRRINGIIHNP